MIKKQANKVVIVGCMIYSSNSLLEKQNKVKTSTFTSAFPRFQDKRIEKQPNFSNYVINENHEHIVIRSVLQYEFQLYL